MEVKINFYACVVLSLGFLCLFSYFSDENKEALLWSGVDNVMNSFRNMAINLYDAINLFAKNFEDFIHLTLVEALSVLVRGLANVLEFVLDSRSAVFYIGILLLWGAYKHFDRFAAAVKAVWEAFVNGTAAVFRIAQDPYNLLSYAVFVALIRMAPEVTRDMASAAMKSQKLTS